MTCSELRLDVRIVTPLFLGGAMASVGNDRTETRTEFRAPAFKAMLRFWYRAIDPDYQMEEGGIFGDSEAGQSMFLVRVLPDTPQVCPMWNPDQYNHEPKTHPRFALSTTNGLTHTSEDKNHWKVDGLRYFSYSLAMNKRRYIPPDDRTLTVRLIFKRTPDPRVRQRLLAAIWLLGHVGGLGSRSRRGFGTIALHNWQATDNGWPECDMLPLAHAATKAEDWWHRFNEGCKILKSPHWFGTGQCADHTVLGTNTAFKLFRDPYPSWHEALAAGGEAMQIFRQRHDLADQNSDYFRVKKHLCEQVGTAVIPQPRGAAVGREPLAESPDRTAFGLPLLFQYSSLAHVMFQYTSRAHDRRKPRRFTPTTTFQGRTLGGKQRDRSASRIHVRVIKIGKGYYPLYIRLDGPLLANNEKIVEQKSSGSGSWDPPNDGILADFWDNLWSGNCWEKTWR